MESLKWYTAAATSPGPATAQIMAQILYALVSLSSWSMVSFMLALRKGYSGSGSSLRVGDDELVNHLTGSLTVRSTLSPG